MSLQTALDKRQNNFDLLRLCAALAVMFGHSFWIQPHHGRVEPILQHTGLEYSGSLAVYTFFLLSGMLVSSSFERQKNVLRFAALRLTRIYPALIVCVALTAFLVYPALSDAGIAASLFGHDAIEYFAKNTWLFSGVQWTLPGIFETAPIKSVVNGSLWTLPLELECYVLVLISGTLGCLNSRARMIIFAVIASVAFAYLVTHGSGFGPLAALTNKPTGYSFYPAPFFLLGMVLYVFRSQVKTNWGVLFVLFVAYAVFRKSSIAAPFFYVTFVYLLLALAMAPALYSFVPKHDYSYGVYLWAFPVQQIVATRYPEMDNLAALAIAVPATVIIAALSWHLVERPCIRFAHSRFGRLRASTTLHDESTRSN
ncbi:acyltransferase [Caballeronia sp. LZ065]|uniref:acyltransferase family protein n=1 Tax=Caballeronia sp. LZ065 TaxID=3038571 RepID=UPI00286484D3|nr:acyltransferase [Caballeronia sp. LZ065]MDR5783658.1 acyltransferase [Caballeronia sp. LZ065]